MNSVAVGDSVVFNSTVRPKYLIGAEAIVKEKNRTRIVVVLKKPVGRFGGGRIVTALSIIDLV